MRKQQIKILDKAEKKGFIKEQIEFLSKESLTIQELQIVFDYFEAQYKLCDAKLLVEEAENRVKFLKDHRNKIASTDDYVSLLMLFLPRQMNKKDVLIGDARKHRIYKLYQFLQQQKDRIERVHPYVFDCYDFMLRQNWPWWHIKEFLRKIISNVRFLPLEYLHYIYPCLFDDYLTNGKDSLLYYMAVETDIIYNFEPDKNALSDLYDQEKHRFVFDKNEFSKYFTRFDYYGDSYFIENIKYIAQRNAEQYPIISVITEFCKKHEVTIRNEKTDIFTVWKIWRLDKESEEERLINGYKTLGQTYEIHLGSYALYIDINKNCFVNVTYIRSNSVAVNSEQKEKWHSVGKTAEYKFTIAPDGRLFERTKQTNKLYPMSMNKFMFLYGQPNMCGIFMNELLKFHQSQNIFYKDVAYDCAKTDKFCIMPLNFNEISEYHNRAELIMKKYKTASNMKINWNKQNINLSYMIVKAYSLVQSGKSQQILIQQKDLKLVKHLRFARTVNDKAYAFLKEIIKNNIINNAQINTDAEKIKEKYRQELVEEMKTDVLSNEQEQWLNEKVQHELYDYYGLDISVSDYVNMCQQSKQKVRLDIRKAKQLGHVHDRVAREDSTYRRITGPVSVPKDSKFLELRKILPEEFEWIQTRKRLILETELQHHCVWSYADKITKDKCAIYSFTDTSAEYTTDGVAKRYTIEFGRKKDGTYYIVQAQGKYDRENSSEIKKYVQELLDEAQKKGKIGNKADTK